MLGTDVVRRSVCSERSVYSERGVYGERGVVFGCGMSGVDLQETRPVREGRNERNRQLRIWSVDDVGSKGGGRGGMK